MPGNESSSGGAVASLRRVKIVALHTLAEALRLRLAYLLAARDERSGVLVWGVVNDPRLDSLRELRPFRQLLNDMGLSSDASRCW